MKTQLISQECGAEKKKRDLMQLQVMSQYNQSTGHVAGRA